MTRNKYIIDRNGICECRKHGRIWREGATFGERTGPNNALGYSCEECCELANPWHGFRNGVSTLQTMTPSSMPAELRDEYISRMIVQPVFVTRASSDENILTESRMNELFEQMWHNES